MRPQLFDYLRGYDGRAFLHDLLAGITVAIVALPLAIGFGIASGVTRHRDFGLQSSAGF